MNFFLDTAVKITLNRSIIVAGRPNIKKELKSPNLTANTEAIILDTKTRLTPINANGNSFLLNADMPATRPNAQPMKQKAVTAESVVLRDCV